MRNDPRTLAVQILTKVKAQHSYANLALDATLQQARLDPRDAALATTLVYGVIQHQLTLDYYLAPFTAGKKLDDWVLALLETAVYQMHYLDKIPDRAIFFESTRIAKTMGHVGIAKLVTAVLRSIQRKGLPDPATIADPLERLSVTYSVPRWLVAKLQDQLGEAKTAAILASINQAPAASLRVNTTKGSREALLAELADRFPDAAPSALSPDGIVAPGGHFAGLPEFAVGAFTMQDESSMLVAPSLDLKPGDRVLDACAAPGGKTTHIAQFLDPAQGGEVVALDLHPHKVRLIAQNAKRLGLDDRVTARAMDARTVGEHFDAATFDKILVDAPCSGLGLLRRKPEIRYGKRPEDLENLPKIQLALLDAVAPLLKSHGRLTYSTCTMVTEENQEVVAAFLAAHPDFHQVPVPTATPVARAHNAPALQLFPDDYGTDGFFIASLERA
ncbi:16S rRNA (cytosine(967)-C(5))-methyltransferase RsmB [Lacticaseibacillus kribbianus]|uniref:16S rRNA (cytosine(967)-C(5))-methyltransferase RsmB n=1 Tax=Lacticaseibacillus kribbianus TaxID=2926292 RepID=UPI001CD19A2B|nr:16S rRNA (cytosine(967)-C(5))-methyltransferase RsmB [Lacticaseibacillus kribbianus]